MSQYIVAHLRDRDSYQVPLALQEQGLLKCFVTDYYHDEESRLKQLLKTRLAHRQSAGIPSSKTRDCWSAVALQAAPLLGLKRGIDWIYLAGRRLGEKVEIEARHSPDADLLLYSNYAREAFTSSECRNRRKNLFLFHPHPALIRSVLEEDYDRYGVGRESLIEESGLSHRMENSDIEITFADHIICASSFSARSVAYSKLSNCPVSIVPYGTVSERMVFDKDAKANSIFKYLFVGQAIQRKGLHHLLAVWKKWEPVGAELSLVCSRVQDNIIANLPTRVSARPGLGRAALNLEFMKANCVVLPSLVEGFGLVLLEALQAGCYIIYSDATGLADYTLPSWAGRLVPAGNLDALRAALEDTLDLMSLGRVDHTAIAELGRSMTMDGFREGIRQSLRRYSENAKSTQNSSMQLPVQPASSVLHHQ